MDFAQLGRNLIAGQGFTTYVLRPLALDGANPFRQPDLVHGPLYPVILAFAFGALGARDGVAVGTSAFFYIATVPVLYLLGTRLFNRNVAGVSALFFALSSTMLHYALSGRHVTLLVFLFTSLLLVLYRVLTLWREGAAQPDEQPRYPLLLAGGLTGLLYLADPQYFWVLLIVLVMVIRFSPARAVTALWFGVPLAVMVLPWMIRNLATSGNPVFGLQGFELLMNTDFYPGASGYRMTPQDVVPGTSIIFAVVKKLFVQSGKLIEQLPEMGAAWVLAFFLPSLFFGFRDPAAGVVRRMVIYSFLALFAATVMFTIEIGLFTALVPALLVFAVSYFLHLMQQAKLARPYQVTVGALLALTLLFPIFGNRNPEAETELRSEAQIAARLTQWSRRDEIILTDKPWMVAWYANRPALWVPAVEPRVKEMRSRFKEANWFFLTNDIRTDNMQWQYVFDAFQQWNLLTILARANRQEPPKPVQLHGKSMPLIEALDGFTTVDVGTEYLPPAVVGYAPESPASSANPD